MTKIIILITLFLIVLSLYAKNKNIKIARNMFCLLSILMVISSFSNTTYISYRRNYLYGKADFEKYAEYAQASFRRNGVFASLTLAQAALEQNFKPPANNNMFGIKGDCDEDSEYVTKECDENGKCYNTTACFRTYDSVEDSFVDHGNFLINEFGNRQQFSKATTLKDQMIALKSNSRAQYATDPNYLCTLASIVKKYDLTKYDEGITYNGRGVTIKGERIDNFAIENCYYVGGGFTDPDDSDTDSSNEDSESYIYTDYNPGTSYTGQYENGYLYQRLKDETTTNELLISKLENGEADKIITEIYGRVITGLLYNGINNGTDDGGGGGGYSGGGLGDLALVDPGHYSTWRQTDSRWGGVRLGTSSATIRGAGCAATSVAIQIARSGVPLVSTFKGYFNPGTFVLAMNAVGGFDNRGRIYWAKASKIAPSFVYSNQVTVNRNNVLNVINAYLSDKNNYLIIHVHGSNNRRTSNHWVAVTGVTNDDIKMIDPASNSTSVRHTYGIEYVDRIVIYRTS